MRHRWRPPFATAENKQLNKTHSLETSHTNPVNFEGGKNLTLVYEFPREHCRLGSSPLFNQETSPL